MKNPSTRLALSGAVRYPAPSTFSSPKESRYISSCKLCNTQNPRISSKFHFPCGLSTFLHDTNIHPSERFIFLLSSHHTIHIRPLQAATFLYTAFQLLNDIFIQAISKAFQNAYHIIDSCFRCLYSLLPQHKGKKLFHPRYAFVLHRLAAAQLLLLCAEGIAVAERTNHADKPLLTQMRNSSANGTQTFSCPIFQRFCKNLKLMPFLVLHEQQFQQNNLLCSV